MLRYFTFTILLTLAWCDNLKHFEGTWTAVKIYNRQMAPQDCNSVNITLTEERCKCGPKLEARVFIIYKDKIPVIVVKKEERVGENIDKLCRCNGSVDIHLVFRYLTDNYFLGYAGSSRFSYRTMLLAKQLPTEEELEEFEASIDELKNKDEQLNDIVVTWSTGNDTQESRVQYGEGVLDKEATGYSTVFEHARGQYVHRVTLKDLKFNTRYLYHCGSKYGWSERFMFKTPPGDASAMVRAAIFGDMGVENAHSLPYLQDESERDHFDFILHVGDFAYDMYEKDGMQGDQFMRQIEPLAAIVPYMTVPGNHEENRNFTQYKSRFSMPAHKSQESMFYSWNIGPIHFVGVNTEAYYFLNYGLSPLVEMYDWLEKDLREANKPENRRIHPWIIIYGHRPMYCSNKFDDCWNDFLPNRSGVPFFGLGMEPLLKQFGVDIVIWAHEHSYERTWPLYDNKVYNGSLEHPYVNPGAPVHVVTGSAGCRELPDPFKDEPAPWSAFRSSEYGYTRFAAHNHTHVHFEQVSVDQGGKVIDSFWVVKALHQPYQF